MGESATSDPGGLLRRMIFLTRISERMGRLEPRRVLLDKILKRMMLFRRMTERLEIAAPQSALTRAVLREAELSCMECGDWLRCRQWLDGKAPDDDYRSFCPNEGLFDVLPRQARAAPEPRA
jgi:hypothetical protein